jgi:hypothetical protein
MVTKAETILKNAPHLAPFALDIPVTTSDEAWVDVDTHLGKDEAWHLKDVIYFYEFKDPTVPYQLTSMDDISWTLQLQRGVDSETLLSFTDDLVYGQHYWASDRATYGNVEFGMPWTMEIVRPITRAETLRLLWRTEANVTQFQDTMHIAGFIRYDLVSAPDDGRTKIGIPLDEI